MPLCVCERAKIDEKMADKIMALLNADGDQRAWRADSPSRAEKMATSFRDRLWMYVRMIMMMMMMLMMITLPADFTLIVYAITAIVSQPIGVASKAVGLWLLAALGSSKLLVK